MENYEFRRDDPLGFGKLEKREDRRYQLTRIVKFANGQFEVQRSLKRFSWEERIRGYRLIRAKRDARKEPKSPLYVWKKLLGEIENGE